MFFTVYTFFLDKNLLDINYLIGIYIYSYMSKYRVFRNVVFKFRELNIDSILRWKDIKVVVPFLFISSYRLTKLIEIKSKIF